MIVSNNTEQMLFTVTGWCGTAVHEYPCSTTQLKMVIGKLGSSVTGYSVCSQPCLLDKVSLKISLLTGVLIGMPYLEYGFCSFFTILIL